MFLVEYGLFWGYRQRPKIQGFFPLPLHSRVVDDSSSPWIMFEDSQFARHVSYAKNRFIWMVDHTLCLAVTFSIASVAKLRCNVISLYPGPVFFLGESC